MHNKIKIARELVKVARELAGAESKENVKNLQNLRKKIEDFCDKNSTDNVKMWLPLRDDGFRIECRVTWPPTLSNIQELQNCDWGKLSFDKQIELLEKELKYCNKQEKNFEKTISEAKKALGNASSMKNSIKQLNDLWDEIANELR